MKKVLRCDCGFEVRAGDQAGLIAGIRRHALDAHRMEFTREEAARLAARAGSEAASSNNRTRGVRR
jgi:predicted small metal-binding protein